VTRPELRGYVTDPARADEELRRCELLRGGEASEARVFFLFEDVFNRLREALPA
jgi:hypothetical protein